MTDLNILARTLAERLTTKLDEMVEFETFKNGRTAGFLRRGASEQTEAVIREAIDKTLEAAVEQADITLIGFIMPESHEAARITKAEIVDAIRSLKQSNSVVEDEGPCADCGQPKSDSAMHLDSPGKGWGAALHWFKQSNSGMEVRKCQK